MNSVVMDIQIDWHVIRDISWPSAVRACNILRSGLGIYNLINKSRCI